MKGNGRGGRGERGLVCRVTREMLIYQGFKGSCGGGGDRAIGEFHVTYEVRVKFLLYNFRQERCRFLGIGARDEGFPAFPSGFPTLSLVVSSNSIKKCFILFSRVLLVVIMLSVGPSP